jgi:DNA polymerase Ligase (LigD)
VAGRIRINPLDGRASPMPRFVILLHQFPSGHPRATHWDLMLESGAALRTWALPSEPAVGLDCDAEQLADHRLAYLEYEGPISDNRGQVSRWDEGAYRLAHESPDALTLVLDGRRLHARVTLEKGVGSHFWRVSLSAAPSSG